MVSLMYVLPTVGRESLRRAVRSLADQRSAHDRICIVANCEEHRLAYVHGVSERYDTLLVVPRVGPHGDVGGAARNAGLEMKCTTHIAYMDDDDMALPGAVEAVRVRVAADPSMLHLFKVCFVPNGALVWTDQEVREGNVSTLGIVHPHVCTRWDGKRGQDGRFAVEVHKELGHVRFHNHVVAAAWPGEGK
jgi:glycosyltransferase involved in cell wall biosynthesis